MIESAEHGLVCQVGGKDIPLENMAASIQFKPCPHSADTGACQQTGVWNPQIQRRSNLIAGTLQVKQSGKHMDWLGSSLSLQQPRSVPEQKPARW